MKLGPPLTASAPCTSRPPPVHSFARNTAAADLAFISNSDQAVVRVPFRSQTSPSGRLCVVQHGPQP
jgi:hypothetical protein